MGRLVTSPNPSDERGPALYEPLGPNYDRFIAAHYPLSIVESDILGT